MLLSGVAAFTMGVLAYTGRWRKWAEDSGYTSYFGFATLYPGISTIMLPARLLLPLQTMDETCRFAYACVSVVIGLVGAIAILFGLPPFLLPRWFKEGRERRREVDRAEKELRKTAKSLRRARRRNE